MAVETSLLQHMTTLTVFPSLLVYFAHAEGKSIYFRSGKSEADDSFEVYHIKHLKEIIGDAFQKLVKGVGYFDLVPTHSQSRTSNIGFRMSHVIVVLFDGQGTSSLATIRRNTFTSPFVTTERLLSTE